MSQGMSAAHASTTGPTRPHGVALVRIGIATLVSAALSATANTLLGLGAARLFDISSTFEPLAGWAAAQSSVVASVGAAVVLAVLARWTSRPLRWFWRISIGFFVLSFGPLIGLILMNTPGGSPAAYGTLLSMHLVAFACTVPVLAKLSVRPGGE
jgi:hypothetical protein